MAAALSYPRHVQEVASRRSDATEPQLAFYALRAEHWPKLGSTNPLERVNREIGRRTDVFGIFPNDKALLRLAASLVIEQDDEWLVDRRYLSLDSLALLLEEQRDNEHQAEEVLALNAA